MKVDRYQKIAPFIIRENIPRVIMFMGKVRILIIGLINIWKSVRQAPTIRETQIGSIMTPDIAREATKTETESINQRKINFI